MLSWPALLNSKVTTFLEREISCFKKKKMYIHCYLNGSKFSFIFFLCFSREGRAEKSPDSYTAGVKTEISDRRTDFHVHNRTHIDKRSPIRLGFPRYIENNGAKSTASSSS